MRVSSSFMLGIFQGKYLYYTCNHQSIMLLLLLDLNINETESSIDEDNH